MLNESSDIIFKALEDNPCVNFSSGGFFAFLQQKGKQREQWVSKLQKNEWLSTYEWCTADSDKITCRQPVYQLQIALCLGH